MILQLDRWFHTYVIPFSQLKWSGNDSGGTMC